MSLRNWAPLYESLDKFLARTTVGDAEVITAWSGTEEFGWGKPGERPTSIFGTVVKRGNTYSDEVRSGTRRAAMTTHAKIVRRLTRESEPHVP